MNPDSDLMFLTKMNSKWIIGLNATCKTIKLLGENIGENVDDLELDNDILEATPKK